MKLKCGVDYIKNMFLELHMHKGIKICALQILGNQRKKDFVNSKYMCLIYKVNTRKKAKPVSEI